MRAVLDATASVAMTGAAIALVWFVFHGRQAVAGPERTVPLPDEPLAVEAAPILGNESAPVGMIAFSDFECPFCGRFANEILPALESEFIDSGKVFFAFRNMPSPSHPHAVVAATAAACAAAQGKFWAFHDMLFDEGESLGSIDWAASANQAGLDVGTFSRCTAAGEPERVSADADLGRRLGIKGTPTFFVGRRNPDGSLAVDQVVTGARPVEEFRTVLRAVLADVEKYGGTSARE